LGSRPPAIPVPADALCLPPQLAANSMVQNHPHQIVTTFDCVVCKSQTERVSSACEIEFLDHSQFFPSIASKRLRRPG
jgi:hypothetical protein